jgi:hypothetical protein
VPVSLPDGAHADDVLASSEHLFLYAIRPELRGDSRFLCSARLRMRTKCIPGKATRIQPVSLSFLLGDPLQSVATGYIPPTRETLLEILYIHTVICAIQCPSANRSEIRSVSRRRPVFRHARRWRQARMLRYTRAMNTNPTSLNLHRWWHA